MKRRGAYLIIFAITTLLAACGTTNEVIIEDTMLDLVPFETVGRNVLHGGGAEGIVDYFDVIDNEDAWAALKERMDKTNPVSNNFKAVNFVEYNIIACIDSLRPNGSYTIEIKDVQEFEKSILVLVEKQHSNLPATSVMVQPFHIVRIPKSDKPVKFQITRRLITPQ